MPPQNNPAPAPAPAPAPSVPPSQNPGFNPESFTKNPKFMTTVKTFAIYVPILMVVNLVVGAITTGLRYNFGVSVFAVPALIMGIISGLIGGAIGGVIFYFIYDPVKNWVKGVAFLTKYIHNMFTLFWIPSLVGSIIGGVFGLLGLMSLGAIAIGLAGAYGAASVGGAFMGVVISFVVNLVIYYFYAKTISAKLEPLYPW